jgi:hypothetical protein
MPGFEETENEIRYRVRDPAQFDDYGRKEIAPGVSLLLGHDKATGKWLVQAIRFDKVNFTLAQAEAWVTAHPDVGKMESKYAPTAQRYRFKIDAPISKLDGTVDSEHFYIYGDASVELVDKENDKITEKALAGGLPQLLRRARLSLVHTDILVGPILDELDYKGTKYRTAVQNGRLTLVGDIWNDTKMCRQVRQGILDGIYNSYSISGEAIEAGTVCDRDGCFNKIDKLDLSAVAVCEEGMNQAAKFTLLGKADDFALAGEVAASPDNILGGMHMEDKTKETMQPTVADKASGDQPNSPKSPEVKQEPPAPPADEQPVSPDQAPPEEASMQDAMKAMFEQLKMVGEAVAALSARVGAIEQGNQAQAQAAAGKAAAEKAAAEKAAEDAKAANASPEPPAKKTLAKDAGGQQFGKPSGKPRWQELGEQVKKAGGLNKPGSPMLQEKKTKR